MHGNQKTFTIDNLQNQSQKSYPESEHSYAAKPIERYSDDYHCDGYIQNISRGLS